MNSAACEKETALISRIQHFSTGDGEGIRTTVFFQGCNLKCSWCHNPETIPQKTTLMFFEELCINCGLCIDACPSQAHSLNPKGSHLLNRKLCTGKMNCETVCPTKALSISGKKMSLNEVFGKIIADIDFYRSSGGGVTLSGGEPLLQSNFCRSLAQKCKENDIHVIIDTAGSVPFEVFEKVLPFTDTFYFDLKATNESDYKRETGGNFTLIKSNLEKLSKQSNVAVRIPIIPGLTDNPDYLESMKTILLGSAPSSQVHLLPFHPLGSGKYKSLDQKYKHQLTKQPDKALIERLALVFKENFDVRCEF